MKMVRTAALIVASLVFIGSVQTADTPKDSAKDSPAALEKLLLGEWQGGPCAGQLFLDADGTFERRHYSPVNLTYSGTWEMRWNAVPPTLVLTCKSPSHADGIGRTEVLRIDELNDKTLGYKYPDHPEWQLERYTRIEKPDELAALQGTWVPIEYEADGKKVAGPHNFRQIIKGDKVTFQVDGETKAEGKVVVDATRNPKRLDLQFTSGQTDVIIYVRAGNYVIYCGNRDGETRPIEFQSGKPDGGEYLQVWKIEK